MHLFQFEHRPVCGRGRLEVGVIFPYSRHLSRTCLIIAVCILPLKLFELKVWHACKSLIYSAQNLLPDSDICNLFFFHMVPIFAKVYFVLTISYPRTSLCSRLGCFSQAMDSRKRTRRSTTSQWHQTSR